MNYMQGSGRGGGQKKWPCSAAPVHADGNRSAAPCVLILRIFSSPVYAGRASDYDVAKSAADFDSVREDHMECNCWPN